MSSKETSGHQPPKHPEPVQLWRLRIQQSHAILVSGIEALNEAAPGTQQETELSLNVANRVGNFTNSILNAHGSRLKGWRECGVIGLHRNVPTHIPIEEHEDGSRTFYNPYRNEVSRVSVLRRDWRGRDVFNFGDSKITSREEWGKDERIRGRVLSKMMGLLPDDVVSGLTDQNRGIKRR